MANIKLSQLTELTTANNQNTIFYVADLSVSPNVSHFIRLGHFTSDNVIAYNAFTQANLAFNKANTATGIGWNANLAFNQANSVYAFANTGYTQANNAASFANSAYAYANTGYLQANNAASFANGAFAKANSDGLFANAAFITANSAAIFANAAFDKANSDASFANSAFSAANSAASFANGAFTKANTAVLRAGDTMTGALNVPTSANSVYDTTAATTAFVQNELRNNRLSFYTPGMVIQTKYVRADAKSTYNWVATANTAVNIADLNISITPLFSTSKFFIQFNVTFECNHDTVFRLIRNVNGVDSYVGINTTDTNYWSGTWMPGYDVDTASTPRTNHMIYFDQPGTALPVTYKLMIQSSTQSAGTFFLNRSASSAGQAAYEVGISQVIVQEIY
jgi:hypothetical protein